jgi:anaerobic ribonucleoside-triphosphate reductase
MTIANKKTPLIKTLLPKVKKSNGKEEEFNPKRITDALIIETGLNCDSAKKISDLLSRKLIATNPTYLTSPLIREMVNSILIEHGFEEERKKHTRIGFPLYDFSLKYDSIKELKVSNYPFSSIEYVLDLEACKNEVFNQVKREYFSLIGQKEEKY